jgi:predicted dehydrogenase
MPEITIACIGAGHWGKNLIRIYSRFPGVRLKAICDLNQEVLSSLKKSYSHIYLTDNYNEIVEDPQIIALVIASPTETHYDIAKRALLANKHVFSEKPLCLEVEQGIELVDLAEKNNKILMIGHIMVYHPAFTHLKKAVDAYELGDLLYIHSQRTNLGVLRKKENALWSLAPHDICMIISLFKETPHTVSAIGGAFINPPVEDVAFVNLSFSKGRAAHVWVGWLAPEKVRKLTVVGSKQMAVFNDAMSSEKLVFHHKGFIDIKNGLETESMQVSYGTTVHPLPPTEPLYLECLHFIECITQNRSPLTDGTNAITIHRILSAAQNSMKNNGNPVRMNNN